MKTLIALTLLTFTISFMENSFAHSQRNEIDHCSNEDYQLSIRNSDQGWLTALVTDRDGSLLAQFQIHFDQTMNDYIGQGFSLRSLNNPSYPVSRDVYFNAELVATGETANGRLVCEPKKPSTEPAGKPHCHGMQIPSYVNGAWHCVGGGH